MSIAVVILVLLLVVAGFYFDAIGRKYHLFDTRWTGTDRMAGRELFEQSLRTDLTEEMVTHRLKYTAATWLCLGLAAGITIGRNLPM